MPLWEEEEKLTAVITYGAVDLLLAANQDDTDPGRSQPSSTEYGLVGPHPQTKTGHHT